MASTRVANSYFGCSVSVNRAGTVIAVGAYRDTSAGATTAGRVYMFTGYGAYWSDAVPLPTASGRMANGKFGYSIALNAAGDSIAVGAYGTTTDSVANKGRVYVFVREEETWPETAILKAGIETNTAIMLGSTVAINGAGTVVVTGAIGTGTGRGSVYIFA